MTVLPEQVDAFLKTTAWSGAHVSSLAADFSTRRFYRLERLSGDPAAAILMQAEPDQKTKQFVLLADLLRRCGLSAPEIYAADPEMGLALMEDFGDTTFGKLLDQGQEALPLYERAVDVLVRLHGQNAAMEGGATVAGLPVFTADAFVDQVELFLDFYFPYALKRDATGDERQAFRAVWFEALKPLESLPQTLMLRDYMPDNLMDLKAREDVKSVGLLDFQDGGLGPVAYDLASLCECVRRDVGIEILDAMIGAYHRQNPVVALEDLRRACRVLAAQRHMRVLGIVARLAQKGRGEKLSCVPRMQNYVRCLLSDDALISVRRWLDNYSRLMGAY